MREQQPTDQVADWRRSTTLQCAGSSDTIFEELNVVHDGTLRVDEQLQRIPDVLPSIHVYY
jgi:hypothetical protein